MPEPLSLDMHIRPLHALSLNEIDDLARAAADRGDDHDSANPYPAGDERHARFQRAYAAREVDLQIDATPA